jgi:glycosyltransferase involved in cell wall biosynthesis
MDPARILYLFGMRQYVAHAWHRSLKQAVNFPDNKTPWVPFAYSAGRKIKYDYVLVTAPPFSAFITGYYLARSSGKPLIADFRDTWLEFPFMPYKGRIQKSFVRYWEHKIVASAKLIIVVDENIRNALIERFPWAAGRMHVLPNGYDPDDYAVVRRPSVFTIAYLGTVRDERDPGHFLSVVEKFRIEQKLNPGDINLKFIGHVEPKYLTQINKYDFTLTTGHQPYRKAINEFCSSHVAVLITTGSEYFFPSRQNEYLASGLPIIVCGKSKGVHLLEDAFKKGYPGWIFDHDDVEGMKKQLLRLYGDFKKGKVIRGKTPYTQFTRENITKRLTDLIKTL